MWIFHFTYYDRIVSSRSKSLSSNEHICIYILHNARFKDTVPSTAINTQDLIRARLQFAQ